MQKVTKLTTFGEAFDLYAKYAKEHLKSFHEVIGLRNRYLKNLEKRKLHTISRYELQVLHTEIGNSAGRTAANRAIEVISSVYNRMLDWDLYAGSNPAQRIKKFRLRSRDRFLLPDEVEPLFAAIDSCESRTVRDFLYICVYTAARSGTVKAMKWSEIDLEQGIWITQDSKNGDPYIVPLLPEAITLLRNRSAFKDTAVYVFPGARGQGHMQNPRKTWYDIVARAGLNDLRIHDLRRTLGSWMLRTGASLAIIQKTLNHRDPRSTLIYARADRQPIISAMTKAMDALFSYRHQRRNA